MNLLEINYKFDTKALLEEAEKKEFSTYNDDKHGVATGWNICRDDLEIGQREAKKVCEFYDIELGQPRFYILEENRLLLPHVDYNTTCSINHMLEDGGAPINIMGDDFTYKTALLNTSVPHGVNNMGRKRRLLFKISFFEQTYEEIREKIRSREAAFSIL